MNLTPEEAQFLTALAREQNQTGCRGPAHDLLRQHAYPDAPLTGAGSLAFSYEAIPLTTLLVRHCKDLQEIDDFLRRDEPIRAVRWPWGSADEYRVRLAEARRAGATDGSESRNGTTSEGGPVSGVHGAR